MRKKVLINLKYLLMKMHTCVQAVRNVDSECGSTATTSKERRNELSGFCIYESDTFIDEDIKIK